MAAVIHTTGRWAGIALGSLVLATVGAVPFVVTALAG
jgi:hypothetical protein